MQINWKMLLGKMTVWMAVEVFLGFTGIDDLADYTEFISQQYVSYNYSPVVQIV